MGPTEKRGLHIWVPVPRGPRPPVTCTDTDERTAEKVREERMDGQTNEWMKMGDPPADIPGFDLSSHGGKETGGSGQVWGRGGWPGLKMHIWNPLPSTCPSYLALPSSHWRWQLLLPPSLLLYPSNILFLFASFNSKQTLCTFHALRLPFRSPSPMTTKENWGIKHRTG